MAVWTAISANALVTVAKFGGFIVTGSGALLAESVHSLADVGNQALLAVGMAQAAKKPDALYPDGYAREAFVWSLISAVGIFFLGAGVSLMHGLQSLFGDHHGEGMEGGGIAIGILVFSAVVEGASLVVALRIAAQTAAQRDKSLWEHIRTSEDPFELAVLLEDSAAVLGVFLALISVGLTAATHMVVWDALGTVLIGLLLGGVAVTLISRNRSLLVGRAASPLQQALIAGVLEADPAVEHVADSAAIVTGADRIRFRAELELDGRVLADHLLDGADMGALHASLDAPESLREYLREFADDVVEHVGDEIDRLEAKVREAVPSVGRIELEAD